MSYLAALAKGCPGLANIDLANDLGYCSSVTDVRLMKLAKSCPGLPKIDI